MIIGISLPRPHGHKKRGKCLYRDSAGTRTQDPYIKSVLLYQLSYEIEPCAREDSNFHEVTPTTPSRWRVYQFHHSRNKELYSGDPAGTRTQDPYIKSVLLYQLSYGIVLLPKFAPLGGPLRQMRMQN
jgi:hypothetical protein